MKFKSHPNQLRRNVPRPRHQRSKYFLGLNSCSRQVLMFYPTSLGARHRLHARHPRFVESQPLRELKQLTEVTSRSVQCAHLQRYKLLEFPKHDFHVCLYCHRNARLLKSVLLRRHQSMYLSTCLSLAAELIVPQRMPATTTSQGKPYETCLSLSLIHHANAMDLRNARHQSMLRIHSLIIYDADHVQGNVHLHHLLSA
jgi:hypothetical protein